jgi:hypothetical protein
VSGEQHEWSVIAKREEKSLQGFLQRSLFNGSPLRGLHKNNLYKETFERSLQRKAHVSSGQKKAKSSGNACLLSSRKASLGPSRWE